MYPTIHDFKADDLNTQGYGALSDCIECSVTEELNGAFTLELTYPLNGLHAEYLLTGNIIQAKPSHNQSRQPFRINQIKRSFANNIQVYANHISYDMSGYTLRDPRSYNSLAQTIDAMNSFDWSILDYYHHFTFSTDMTSSKQFSQEGINTLRAWMGGKEGSILDVYGGEWSYDRFSCFLNSRRGQDTGYRISYGKNLAEYEKQKDLTEYSYICAYWKKSEIIAYSDLTPTGLDCALRIGYVDATSAFDNQPSTAQLNTYAQNYVLTMPMGGATITVTPAQLGNDVIGLGDGVLICYETVFSTRVIKTVWDVLIGKYTSLQLGAKKVSITDTIKSLNTGPNGEISGNTADDYIVERGVSGAWTFEKWYSGKAVAYTATPYNIGSLATTQGYGNGFYRELQNYNLPAGLFVAAPSVLVQVHADTGLLTANAHSVSASSYSIYVGNMRNETVANAKLNVYAQGKWQ